MSRHSPVWVGALPTVSGRFEAILLLLATGAMLGAIFPVSKLAGQAGVPPMALALAMMLGAGLILVALAVVGRHTIPLDRRYLVYSAVSGLVSMALPNLILFSVIPHLGAGLAAVVYTLSPFITVMLAAFLKVERPTRRRLLGIGLGFAGAVMIVGPRGSLPSPDLYGWMALAFLIPVILATGNVYRTIRWPAGVAPLSLAAGTMLAGATWVGLAMAATGRLGELALIGRGAGFVLLQIGFAAVQFLLFFRLQKVAGPVYLSQIGYVGTAVGLAAGVLVFGERYSLWVWAATGIIATGVLVVSTARR